MKEMNFPVSTSDIMHLSLQIRSFCHMKLLTQNVVIIPIYGMVGSGKTYLANYICNTLKTDFPNQYIIYHGDPEILQSQYSMYEPIHVTNIDIMNHGIVIIQDSNTHGLYKKIEKYIAIINHLSRHNKIIILFIFQRKSIYPLKEFDCILHTVKTNGQYLIQSSEKL